MAQGAIMGQQGANRQLSNLSNVQKALNNLGAGVRPNLLDNWYFSGGGGANFFPINQRGQSSYAVNRAYSIDRWRMENYQNVLNLSVESDCIRLQKTEALANPGVYQIIGDQTLVGQTVTFSILYRGIGLSNFKINSPGNTQAYVFQDSSEWNLASVTYVLEQGNVGIISNLAFVGIQVMSGAQTTDYMDILAVKLELGGVQTLACQDNNGDWCLFEWPDYTSELAKCLRYFQNLNIDNYISGGFYNSTNGIWNLPINQMRITPTISNAKYTRIIDNSGKYIRYENVTTEFFILNSGSAGTVLKLTIQGDNASFGPAVIADFVCELSSDL